MKQRFDLYKEKLINFWSTRSQSQKRLYIGSILLFLVLVIGGSIFFNTSNMMPLYNNLSLQEVGQIKAELDTRGIKYEIAESGTTIKVPKEQVDTLLVELAAQGIPNTGNIDYSIFSENISWGMTDNQFDMIQLDAMQTELANLMMSVDGIVNANVMINKPKEAVFVSEETQQASASIVIETTPGYQFEDSQIRSLYHLVSKAVPNLPIENIGIMNQNFEYFDLNNSNPNTTTDTYAFQQDVKKDIERDIQRRVQQMIGMMVGGEKVVASVTADIDFTQENRVEELVEPINEDVQGLPVSIESITETYTGNPPVGGEPGTGEEDVTNYPADDLGNNGDYEMVRESINNEFNRIRRDIVESPYKIRDLGIQVAIDNTKDTTGDNQEVQYLTTQEEETVREGISSILDSIVTTSIDKAYGEINPEEKVSIVFQEFNGKPTFSENAPQTAIPYWVYGVGAALVLLVLVLLLKRRKKGVEEEEMDLTDAVSQQQAVNVPDIEEQYETETSVRRKQLEKMAKDKPDEFAKLLRSWIAED